MFGIGFSEMILIGVIALIFIGPQQLPGLARTIGRALNELKRASEDLTGQFFDARDNVGRDIRNTVGQIKTEPDPHSAQAPLTQNSVGGSRTSDLKKNLNASIKDLTKKS